MRSSLLLTAVTPAVWGTTYAVTTEFLPPGRPLLAGVLRALPAGLLLLAVTRRLPSGVWWWRSAVLGALNIGLFFALLFVTAYRLPGGMAAVLGAAQPLVVAGLTVLLLTERVPVRTVVAAVAGAGGVALAVLTASARLDTIGVLAGLTGTASMAFGLVLTKRWGRPGVSLLAATGWQLTAGGLLLAPVALLAEGLPPRLSATNLAGYAYLALIGTALAYSLWFRGLDRLPAARVALLGLLSPLVAAAVGWAALGQQLTPLQLTGMVIAFAAVAWGQTATRPRERLRVRMASAQVGVLDDVAGKADASGPEHGLADAVAGGDVFRRDPHQQRDQRADGRVDGVVETGLGPHAAGRLDHAGAEGIAVGQQRDDVPLGAPLHPGPHLTALEVGAGARDVHKGDFGVELREGARGGHRVVVGDPGVRRLVHADRGHAQAVEAGVVPAQLLPDRGEVGEVVETDLAQPGVRDAGRRADDGQHLFDVRREQALPQHALPDHARRAEDHDLHRSSLGEPAARSCHRAQSVVPAS
ncbi:DMT family transporter [Actinoplanes sp. URMC 104]|uniref:DMT family transporter n=1 Tax=Actinoplanes sp. URMC 104 TaxID=3423409 RepID=UPI003F1CA935